MKPEGMGRLRNGLVEDGKARLLGKRGMVWRVHKMDKKTRKRSGKIRWCEGTRGRGGGGDTRREEKRREEKKREDGCHGAAKTDTERERERERERIFTLTRGKIEKIKELKDRKRRMKL